MYLLDTDTVIYILKGHLAVKKNLEEHLYDPIKLSVITLMELYYGAYKSQKVSSNLAKIKALEGSLEIIPLGQEIVELFGLHKAKLEKAGTALDDFDLIIGSTCIANGYTIVTNNEKHFNKIPGVKVVNWTKKPT